MWRNTADGNSGRTGRLLTPAHRCIFAGGDITRVIPLSWAEDVGGIARMIPLAPVRIPIGIPVHSGLYRGGFLLESLREHGAEKSF